jgi:hypothetical protein
VNEPRLQMPTPPLTNERDQPPGIYFNAFLAAQYLFIRTETALFAAADIGFRLRLDAGGAPPMTTSSIDTGAPSRPFRWGNSLTNDTSSALSS